MGRPACGRFFAAPTRSTCRRADDNRCVWLHTADREAVARKRSGRRGTNRPRSERLRIETCRNRGTLGGAILSFEGDSLMAGWKSEPDPAALASAVWRSCHCALSLQREIGQTIVEDEMLTLRSGVQPGPRTSSIFCRTQPIRASSSPHPECRRSGVAPNWPKAAKRWFHRMRGRMSPIMQRVA